MSTPEPHNKHVDLNTFDQEFQSFMLDRIKNAFDAYKPLCYYTKDELDEILFPNGLVTPHKLDSPEQLPVDLD